MDSGRDFLKKNLGIIIGAGIGIIIGVLFLTIGFFPTLLLSVLGGVGAVIGSLPIIREAIRNFFVHLIEKILNR